MPGTDKNPEAEHIMDFLDTGYILPCRIPMRIPMPDTGPMLGSEIGGRY